MSRLQFWLATALGALCLVLALANITLASMNRGLQGDIGARQQFVQQSVQLEGLYREIIRALAELGARHNDQDVRALLQRHGITYTVNPQAAAPALAPAAAARK
ncbi:MAG: hypothetical protein Q7U99_20145 [Rubrivivax sp.]|nr:hypothetical protein [Rubrivivax sp.]